MGSSGDWKGRKEKLPPERRKKIDRVAIEEQLLDIIESAGLPDLDQIELSEELRSRVEGADITQLEMIERELGVDVTAVSSTVPVEEKEEPWSEEEKHPPLDSTISDEEVFSTPTGGEAGRPVDGRCEIKISEDRMSALIDLYPSEHGGRPVTLGYVRESLRSAGVVFGVNEELLKKLVQDVEQSKDVKRGVIIARGRAPEVGRDGSIEYHFGDDDSVLQKSK